MELTKDEVSIVLSLISLAWQAGGVRSEADAASLGALKVRLSEKK